MPQGGPLLPTIFNVVVDAVVCHWEYMVVEGDGGNYRYKSRSDEEYHPERRTIRVCDNKQWRIEGRHTWLKFQTAFYMGKTEW